MNLQMSIFFIFIILVCYYLTYSLQMEKHENEMLKKQINNQNTKRGNVQRIINNEDLAFLDNLINIKCTYYLEFELTIKGYDFITNELLEKIIKDVNLSILNYLSDEMKDVLSQRFSPEGLSTYIYMKTFPKIAQLTKKTNIPK